MCRLLCLACRLACLCACRVAPLDFVIMLLTFLVTVLWDVEKGLVLGLLASVIVLLIQVA